jgi:hypothetical protein
MPLHKDFEIWFDEETQRYRFSVEYWGSYGAKTREEIEEKVKKARRDVKARLRKIDEQNKAYYAKMARKEEQLKKELKAFKHRKDDSVFLKYKELSPEERKKLLKMILDGFDELKIKELIPVNSSTIAALKKQKKEKDVRENIPKNETLPRTSERRIIMPSYTKDVIKNTRFSDN